MSGMKKVVFDDAGRNKVAYGYVSFEDDFIKVTDSDGRSILINKEHIVFIRDGDY
jgi:hypothetical protein